MRGANNLPAWFRDGKFGLFIHWGPYSILGGEWNGRRIEPGDIAEWIMLRFRIPVAEYRRIAGTFNPTKFDARAWVSLAKAAGMRYLVFTAKHHDGFAMYRSKVSAYNIVEAAPFGRDPLAELAEACAGAGIVLGIYYSHREDWDHPYAYGNTWDYSTSQSGLDTMDHPALFQRYLDEKAVPQIEELLTNYGPIGLVWFDRGMYTQAQGRMFADLVHSLQPGCLVNGRVGHYEQELLGDYQSLSDNGMPSGGIEEFWESPQTLNDTWGYSRFDQNWKTPREVIRKLVAVVSKGGNALLNVGPTGEGLIPASSVEILTRVGEWMGQNGESLYGASPSPFPVKPPWGCCTAKRNRLYLHVFDRPAQGILRVAGLRNPVRNAFLLAAPAAALILKSESGEPPSIALPAGPADEIDSVVVLDIDGPPEVDPLVIRPAADGTVNLDCVSGTTFGRAAKRSNRKGEEDQFHISKMQGPEDGVEWHVRIDIPGPYDVEITYAARPGWEDGRFVVRAGRQTLEGSVLSAPGWFAYRTERLGRFDLPAAGDTIIRLFPKKALDHFLFYLKALELAPSQVPGKDNEP